jgi:hypothetical protein
MSKMDDLLTEYEGLGFTTGSFQDRVRDFLASKGNTGSVADGMRQYRTGGLVTETLDPSEVP